MPADYSLAAGVGLEVEVQTALLKGVILHKPVGLNRHFKLMLIQRYSVILPLKGCSIALHCVCLYLQPMAF